MGTCLHLFGRPRIERDGEVHDLPFERRHQLLVYLALKRNWVGRPELAAMLWPGQTQNLAYANLRKTLFRLQSLAWAPPIEVQANAMRFATNTDVADFELALAESRVDEALSLRQGELLTGFDDDGSDAWSDWLGFERERLRSAWRAAALDRMAGEIDAAQAVVLSTQLLEADPIDEAALRAHMLVLARSGQVAGARRAYRDFTLRLERDFGLEPGAELKALHDTLGVPGSREPLVRAAPPAGQDGFVGRWSELQRIGGMLQREDCRLVCLIGPGGVGKTRLARRAVREFAPPFADGAVFVSLEDVLAPDGLAAHIARELGIVTARTEPLKQAREFLRERELLLVLDNFEHLLPAAPVLDDLLQACPRLRMLVTSRVRLGLAAEWSLPVEGLPCPDPEDREGLEAFDAVRVFVSAAQRVQPGFAADREAAAIIDICRQVDGLPLALELAGGWTRVLSCEAIASELRQGTELLRAVDPARPPRHASVEVVFDQSWALLNELERDALARLSVFRGGFTSEAASAIAGASLPLLGALMDKSLLRKDGARIFLHPMVQQLAGVRLGDGEVALSTQAAHAHYYMRLLAQLRHPVRAGERSALAQLDAECDNCAAAWRWAIEHKQVQMMMPSVFTLLSFSEHRGRAVEGLQVLGAAAQECPLDADPRFKPLLSSAIAQLQYRLDRYNDAATTALAAVEGSRPARDGDALLQCHKTLGSAYLRLGRNTEARKHFKKALELAPAATDTRNAAVILGNLALVEKALGHFDESRKMSLQSLELYRRLGDVPGEALCLTNLSTLLTTQGDYASAMGHLKASLELCDRHGLGGTRAFVLANLCEVSFKMEDLAASQAWAGRALEASRLTGNRMVESTVKLYRASVATRLGQLADAREDLRSAIEISIAIASPSYAHELSCFADILAAQGEPDCAVRVREWPEARTSELVHRILVETPMAYTPLIAALRPAR